MPLQPSGFQPAVSLPWEDGESEEPEGPGAPGCREAHGGGSPRPRVPRPGGSPSAGLDWWSRGEGKLRILRAVGVGRGSGWKKGAAGRSRAPHGAALGSPAAPRSVPAAPGPPSAGFAARSVSFPGPRSVVASVDRQARSKRLICSASGVMRGRTRNLPPRLLEICAKKVNIPLRRSCAPRKGKGIPRIKEKRKSKLKGSCCTLELFPPCPPSPASTVPSALPALSSRSSLPVSVRFTWMGSCRFPPLSLVFWT